MAHIETHADRMRKREEDELERFGVLKLLHGWLMKTQPQFFYRLHPRRCVLTVSSSSFQQTIVRYYENIILSKEGKITLNHQNLYWLAEIMQDKFNALSKEIP